MKTYQQLKNEVAIENGFKSWDDMEDAMGEIENLFHELNNPESWKDLEDRAIEMYAQEAIKKTLELVDKSEKWGEPTPTLEEVMDKLKGEIKP